MSLWLLLALLVCAAAAFAGWSLFFYHPETVAITEKGSGDEITILDHSIVQTSRGCAKFQIVGTGVKNLLELKFDYIDTKDGSVFEIQHTGTGMLNFKH